MVDVQVVAVNGSVLYNTTLAVQTEPNTSKKILNLGSALGNIRDVVFLRLQLSYLIYGTSSIRRDILHISEELIILFHYFGYVLLSYA